MLPFGHAAGGYLTGTILAVITKSKNAKALRIIGLVSGLLPDVDLLGYSILRKFLPLKESPYHHKWVTHTFPFYLVLGAMFTLLTGITKQTTLRRYVGVVTVSACVHLIQDMFGSGDGIQLFFPFSKRMVGVRLLSAHGREWRRRYVRDPMFLIEIAIVLLGVFVASRNK